jgi:4'-phosphopantetheinyl transferase
MTRPPTDVDIYRIPISSKDLDVQRPNDSLSAEEKRRITRFASPERRLQARIAWEVRRHILAGYLDCSPGDVPGTGRSTNPILNAFSGPLYENMTHSRGWALLAVSRGARIGVDIERIQTTVDVDRLARRFFHPDEVDALTSLPEDAHVTAFFRTWIRKEAYLKAIGGGVPAALRRFSVSVAPNEPPAILETELEPGAASAFSLYDIDVPEGYVGALAAEGTGHRIRCFDDEIRGYGTVESEMGQSM